MTSGFCKNTPPQGLTELQQKLNEKALTRLDKMEAARELISDDDYPPDHLLNDVADLLAINLDQPSRD